MAGENYCPSRGHFWPVQAIEDIPMLCPSIAILTYIPSSYDNMSIVLNLYLAVSL